MSTEFDRWVHAFQQDAWSLANLMLREPAQAEDAVQEAFIKLWQNQTSVDHDRVKPWLMRVVRNQCIDQLRRRQTQAVRLVVSDEGQESVDPRAPESLDSQFEQQALQREISDAIQTLKEPYRSIVILRDVLQHSYEEVAATTLLSLSQVKVYLHRARKQLRGELQEKISD